jgi:hypothetical protein
LEIEQMGTAPEIVALTTAREASDDARALEVLSDRRSLGGNILFGLLIFAVAASAPVLKRVGVFGTELFAMVGFEFALLAAVVLGAEVYRLRRRVSALAYLLLQRERKDHEP